MIVYKEFIKLKEDPLSSQRHVTKTFLNNYKLLEVRRIDAAIIELIHRRLLLPARKMMYPQEERSMRICAKIPHLF